MLDVSRRTVLDWRRRKMIPEPFLVDNRRMLWTRIQIECWIESSKNNVSG